MFCVLTIINNLLTIINNVLTINLKARGTEERHKHTMENQRMMRPARERIFVDFPFLVSGIKFRQTHLSEISAGT